MEAQTRVPRPGLEVIVSYIAADPRAHGADAFSCKEHFGSGLLREVWARYGASRHNGASTRP